MTLSTCSARLEKAGRGCSNTNWVRDLRAGMSTVGELARRFTLRFEWGVAALKSSCRYPGAGAVTFLLNMKSSKTDQGTGQGQLETRPLRSLWKNEQGRAQRSCVSAPVLRAGLEPLTRRNLGVRKIRIMLSKLTSYWMGHGSVTRIVHRGDRMARRRWREYVNEVLATIASPGPSPGLTEFTPVPNAVAAFGG